MERGFILGILLLPLNNFCLAITVIIFVVILLIITIVDLNKMEIPNTLVIVVFVLGIISIFTMPGTSLPSRILGMFVVSVPLLLITILVPGAFGGGDIKLMAACGLFLGTKLTLLSFAFAVLTGGLYGIWLLVMKKKSGKEHFAFGPFLCLGMAAALFIGDRVWDCLNLMAEYDARTCNVGFEYSFWKDYVNLNRFSSDNLRKIHFHFLKISISVPA